MLSSLKSFISDIEEYIYKTHLVYRSLLVTSTDKEGLLLKKHLENRDYSVMFLDSKCNVDAVADYNQINNRIVIVSSSDKFKEFINYLDLANSSFNFIGFSYHIEAQVINDMLSFYVINKTDNNKYNTIIYYKEYKKLVYLNSIRK